MLAKKKSGRPPIYPTREPSFMKGAIVNHPKSNYIIEAIYDKASTFKTIFDSIYACNKRQVYVIFKTKSVTLYYKDHQEKLTFCVTIMASNFISYFCREVTEVIIDTEDLKKSCNIVKKDIGSIRFLITRENLGKVMYVSLNDVLLPCIDKTPISLATNDDQKLSDNISEILKRQYSVSFKLPSTHFKKRLINYKTQELESCTLSWDSNSKSNFIKFQYQDLQKKLTPKTVYKNSDLLQFKVHNKALEKLSIVFNLESLINVFKVVVAQEFYILMSNEYGLCLNFYMDPVEDYNLSQKYIYGDNIVSKKYSVIFRIFLSKGL